MCEHCGQQVIGDGYTNHCPACLYSKHVDNNPGDRQNVCQGLMQPIAAESRSGEYVIVHRCIRCGTIKRNKMGLADDGEVMIGLGGGGL